MVSFSPNNAWNGCNGGGVEQLKKVNKNSKSYPKTYFSE
jgi:hypothetical protein